jgi:catechol 2,3-dioxygenase-like lactoylglutathione lyase family enzyme
VHPAEAFGVAWEFFGRSFHDLDDPPVPYVEPLKSSDYWREHPIGYLGLKRLSVVASDTERALEFFQGFLGSRVAYETDRPAASARAVGVELGDTVVELLTPVGPGPIERYLARYGDGIRSTVFAVEDIGRARRHFAERGISLQPGDADGSFSVGPENNLGLIFEFSE